MQARFSSGIGLVLRCLGSTVGTGNICRIVATYLCSRWRYACTYVCIYIYLYAHLSVCPSVCLSVYVCSVCICVHMCMYMHSSFVTWLSLLAHWPRWQSGSDFQFDPLYDQNTQLYSISYSCHYSSNH